VRVDVMDNDVAWLHQFTGSSDGRPLASPRELDGLEEAIGVRIPRSLRDIYLTIPNGSFGPGYGLIPLVPQSSLEAEETVLELYRSLCLPDEEDSAWNWPKKLIPFYEWGCAIRSCSDCSTEEGRVIRFDPNGHGPGVRWDSAFEEESPSIRSWFLDLLSK
jgi:hypothetical protein